MSDDIYENIDLEDIRQTNLMVNKNFNEEIYTNQENLSICHQRSTTSGSSSSGTRCVKSVVWCLILLCTLLLVAVAWLSMYINNLTVERDNVQSFYNNLTERTNQTLNHYIHLAEECDQFQTRYNDLTEEKKQMQNQYNSLVRESNQVKSERDGIQRKLSKLETDISQSGWIAFRSSLYYISTNKKKWRQSRDDCAQRGAHLVIITTKEEQEFVKNFMYNVIAWIGLNDLVKEGEWKWVDGSALTSKFWHNAEPNGKIQENCVVTGNQNNWKDYPCDNEFVWICEKKSFSS